MLSANLLDNRYLVLYLQYSNGTASNPAFANLINGKSRIVKKEQNEGVACSAHLVIDITPTNNPNRFHAVLEDMQGLSCRMVCSLINYITKSYKVQDPKEKDKSHKPYARLEFFAKKNFEEQFKEGKLESIVAFKEKKKLSSVMDDDMETIQYKEVHRLEFVKPSLFTEVIAYLAQAARIAKDKGFDKLKITHKNNQKQQSSDYDLPNHNMDNDALYEDIRLAPFISKQCIYLDKPIGICNHKWNSQIIRVMISSLNQ
ncbi:hypothetical protein [Histophilus somni]|uniref:hypothetical protein n=1 Tax=Histophilus somni TaxID=731 RepID=UPI0011D2CDF7|nr:hypothetical protein [Histophilus somni]QEH25658.1 hypothetical protein FWK61_07805 [Histophilus somni]